MNASHFSSVNLLPLLPLFVSCSGDAYKLPSGPKPNPHTREEKQEEDFQRPNIIFAIADDQSYPYASAYGGAIPGMLNTPGFDYVASAGVSFSNAYATSPGSSPSRASILTGLFPWQIEEAGTHASSFPSKFICYPDVFEAAGYKVGFTGKGWGPGDYSVSGRKHNPAGPPFNKVTLTAPYTGISNIDYSGNFKKFLDEKDSSQPFCFWYGGNEPHRGYEKNCHKKAGKDAVNAVLPGFLPDFQDIRGDLMDYAVEIEWFDKHLSSIIEELRHRGLLSNTIIIVTADNGMPFPRAKANCYDAGMHVPLAICWGDNIKKHGIINDVVSLVDIFPTLLDLSRVEWSAVKLSGQSLAPLLGIRSGTYSSKSVFSGRERHSCARYNNWGYPIRSIRSGNYLLIHNFHPERWPAGDPLALNQTNPQNGYYDIDGGPTKTIMINHRNEAYFKPFFQAAVGMRPEFELFNVATDPECMTDLSSDPDCAAILEQLKEELNRKLLDSGDTRLGDNPEIWETYPRLSGDMREFPPY